MKSNICFLISDMESSGGTQRMLCCLCNLLVDHFNIIIMVHFEGDSFFPLDPRIKVNVLPIASGILKTNLKIYKILKTNKIKYYISLDSNSLILNGFLIPSFTRIILWEHFSIENNLKKLLFTISRHYAVIRCKKLVFLSKSEVRAWSKYTFIAKNKSELIYNPLSINTNNIDKSNKMHLKVFLAIGNITNIKGFDILLDAWATLNTDWKLRIVGIKEDQILDLKKIVNIKNIKNVELYGKVKNIQNFYKEASVFLLPSRVEATPLVLIESQAYGLPAITFNHLPGVLELVNKSALIADFEKKEESFSRAMESIINDSYLYEKLHLNALNNANKFNLEKFKNRWLDVLI